MAALAACGPIAGNPDKIRIAYQVDGGRRLEEWERLLAAGLQRGTPGTGR